MQIDHDLDQFDSFFFFPFCILENSLNTEMTAPTPLRPEELLLSREVLCSFPPVGTVLRVFADKFFKEFPHLLNGGCWVRLCNINCEVQSGIWKGMLKVCSKIRLLSDDESTVLDCLK